jgi:hypothetical protein
LTAGTFIGALTGNASTATTLQTARTIGGVSFNGSTNINLPGVNTAGNQNTTGSAASLTTARAINGVNFNGSADITVPAAAGTLTGATLASGVTASSLTSVGTLSTLVVGNPSGIRLRSVESGGVIYVQAGNGTGGSANTITFAPWTSTISTMSIDIANRRVGIKKAAPTVELDVDGAGAFTGTVTVPNITKSGTSGVGNIGQSNNSFDTVFAKATSAQYADLAEVYTSDQNYAPGTVVVFGGEQEITISSTSHDPSVAGVVSTNPAYLMNTTALGSAVALQGRVPTRVKGPVAKGDRVVSSDVPGVAVRLDPTLYEPGCIIGKSIENIADDSIQTIEIVVGRN